MKTKMATGIVALFLAMAVTMTATVQACELYANTPGFWKNHTDLWPEGVETTDTLGDWFVFPSELAMFEDDTILEALSYKGGNGIEGAARIMLRAAAAALLNAEYYGGWSPSEPPYQSGYAYSTSEVIELVNDVLASLNRDTMLWLNYVLDSYNNQEFPY